MAVYIEGRRLSEAEPFGLLTEGAAGIAAIVLAVIALAGVSSGALASIVTIIIGVALIVQAFNAAAEAARSAVEAQTSELGGEVLIDIGGGVTGIVLGILGLVGVNAPHVIPAALIVFGGSLILSGVMATAGGGMTATSGPAGMTAGMATSTTQQIGYRRSNGTMGGLEILVGFASVILGILALIFMHSWVLVLAGFIAVGAALLMVSASFSGAVVRLFTATA